MKQCSDCGSLFEVRGNSKRCPECRPARRGGGATPVLAATRAHLAAIGKEHTPLGETAIVLAARLDGGDDPGSAMAAMAKELRAVMNELSRSAPALKDPVDELRAKRKARLGA